MWPCPRGSILPSFFPGIWGQQSFLLTHICCFGHVIQAWMLFYSCMTLAWQGEQGVFTIFVICYLTWCLSMAKTWFPFYPTCSYTVTPPNTDLFLKPLQLVRSHRTKLSHVRVNKCQLFLFPSDYFTGNPHACKNDPFFQWETVPNPLWQKRPGKPMIE